MNILILSAGTRNKVVRYFKNAVGPQGTVIATDMSDLAPAVYEADRFYRVPRITDPNYLDIILDICRKEKVDGVLSLIDPELSLLSANEAKFSELGVTVIGSNYRLCEMCLDKWQMYQWLCDHGFRCARSYIDKEAFFRDAAADLIHYPVFVKPICGSASISISKAYDAETVEHLFAHHEGLMIQEYLDGQEIGADVYIDMVSGEPVSVFTKKKLVMRAGETDKAVSFKDESLFALIVSFVKEAGFQGPIDIDIFDVDGQYYISEVNPRFGGGYPHAYECGCDHMTMIRNNLNGTENENRIGAYDEGVFMMKYNEIMIRKFDA